MAKEKTQAVQGADKTPKAAPGKPVAKGAEGPAKSGRSLTGTFDAARDFFEQSKVELKKVTWPTRQETVKTGIAVLVFSVVMAIYLGVVDMALSRLVAFILS